MFICVYHADFQAFVAETAGCTTESEIFGWSFVFHTAIPDEVIKAITSAVLNEEWWLPVNGSYWKYPEGPLGGCERVLKGLSLPTVGAVERVQQPEVDNTKKHSALSTTNSSSTKHWSRCVQHRTGEPRGSAGVLERRPAIRCLARRTAAHRMIM